MFKRNKLNVAHKFLTIVQQMLNSLDQTLKKLKGIHFKIRNAIQVMLEVILKPNLFQMDLAKQLSILNLIELFP